MSSSAPSSSVDNKNNNEKDVIMLSGYPFYMNGPDPKAIAAVADKTRISLESILGANKLKSFNRMGSSAIDGIAGTPVCDLLVEISPWPMSNDDKEKMALSGYEYKGTSPHDAQDEWFWGGDGKPGHLGRIVLHTIPEGSEFRRDMKAFVEYVNTHPDAFRRYNDAKMEGAKLMSQSSEEDGRLIGYKMKKAEVCNQIKKEAIEWWTNKDKEEE